MKDRTVGEKIGEKVEKKTGLLVDVNTLLKGIVNNYVEKIENIIEFGKFERTILQFLESKKDKDIYEKDWNELFNKIGIQFEILFLRRNSSRHGERYTSDSSVFAINDGKILKIYPSLSRSEIKKYHEIQNQISKKIYSFDIGGDIDGEKFNRIDVEVLNLGDTIGGNREESFSIIDNVSSKYKNSDINFGKNIELCHEGSENGTTKYLIYDILKKIYIENNLENKIPNVFHGMNIKVKDLENGCLKLIITDIGNSIPEIIDKKF